MKLYREATKVMPRISFNNGKMSVVGRAIPVSNVGICEIFHDYVKNYLQQPDPLTEVSIDLDYINCETQRCLVQTFKMLDDYYVRGHQMIVNWIYEEDDEIMLELGNIIQSLVSIPFQFVEKDWDKKREGVQKVKF